MIVLHDGMGMIVSCVDAEISQHKSTFITPLYTLSLLCYKNLKSVESGQQQKQGVLCAPQFPMCV